ncbi:MAG: DUF255 domain-containing protein [Chitinophagaceae bacterium]
MKKRILFLVLSLPLLLFGQDSISNHINWSKGLLWKQMLDKAKAENKYIFVDCYATWCGPCKLMDREVFTKKIVADFMNSSFLSVKVQMDSTDVDGENVKQWYGDAQLIRRLFKVELFPTYLFFSPSGNIVHRFFGARRDTDFIKLAANALDPQKQFYTLLGNYKLGKKDYTVMPYLVKKLEEIGEKEIANAIAQDYINNYLLALSEDEFYTVKNIEFMGSRIYSSNEKSFSVFYNHVDKIDSFISWKKGYAKGIINSIIMNEEVISHFTPAIKKKTTPNWNKIGTNITKKYNRYYAKRNILSAKVMWYQNNQDWGSFAKYALLEAEKYGLDTSSLLSEIYFNNEVAWNGVFLHSNRKRDIRIAIKWMQNIVSRHPEYPEFLDTYASLLFKAGKNKTAIAIEEKAVMIDPNNKDIYEKLLKMRKGEPTWKE